MSVLFEPVRIGRMESRNRFVRSATYYGLADENGFVGDASVELMRRLARNEVGLIITGYAFVVRSGQVFADMNGIDSDEQIPGYRRMTDAVHELGGRILMQIAHGGVESKAAELRGLGRLAVSAAEDAARSRRQAREMSDEEIEAIIDAFAQSARRVEEAGFDGVQIHGAHGYLVSQFLSPRINGRRDRWGGGLENRMRFVIEVARATRRQVDDDFPLTIKLGCRDYFDEGDGLGIEEGAGVAAALEREGVCFIEVSHGAFGPAFRKLASGTESRPVKEAYLLPDAEAVRKSTSVPLALVGGLRSPPAMEAIVESGAADLVSICRPLIREPDLIRRWRAGDARPAACLSCRGCIEKLPDAKSLVRCRHLK